MDRTNPYKRLLGLVTTGTTRVGHVIAHEGTESVIVDRTSGQQIRAAGTGIAVGKLCMIRNGEVVQELPDLPEGGTHYV